MVRLARAALCILLPVAVSAAEPFPVSDMAGERHDLRAVLDQGQSVAFVFWQPWCKACGKEAPAVALAATVHAATIRFIGVIAGPDAYVDDSEVRRVAAGWGYFFPQVRDRDLSLVKRFGVSSTPTIVVLSHGGSITYRGRLPPPDWADPNAGAASRDTR